MENVFSSLFDFFVLPQVGLEPAQNQIINTQKSDFKAFLNHCLKSNLLSPNLSSSKKDHFNNNIFSKIQDSANNNNVLDIITHLSDIKAPQQKSVLIDYFNLYNNYLSNETDTDQIKKFGELFTRDLLALLPDDGLKNELIIDNSELLIHNENKKPFSACLAINKGNLKQNLENVFTGKDQEISIPVKVLEQQEGSDNYQAVQREAFLVIGREEAEHLINSIANNEHDYNKSQNNIEFSLPAQNIMNREEGGDKIIKDEKPESVPQIQKPSVSFSTKIKSNEIKPELSDDSLTINLMNFDTGNAVVPSEFKIMLPDLVKCLVTEEEVIDLPLDNSIDELPDNNSGKKYSDSLIISLRKDDLHEIISPLIKIKDSGLKIVKYSNISQDEDYLSTIVPDDNSDDYSYIDREKFSILAESIPELKYFDINEDAEKFRTSETALNLLDILINPENKSGNGIEVQKFSSESYQIFEIKKPGEGNKYLLIDFTQLDEQKPTNEIPIKIVEINKNSSIEEDDKGIKTNFIEKKIPLIIKNQSIPIIELNVDPVEDFNNSPGKVENKPDIHVRISDNAISQLLKDITINKDALREIVSVINQDKIIENKKSGISNTLNKPNEISDSDKGIILENAGVLELVNGTGINGEILLENEVVNANPEMNKTRLVSYDLEINREALAALESVGEIRYEIPVKIKINNDYEVGDKTEKQIKYPTVSLHKENVENNVPANENIELENNVELNNTKKINPSIKLDNNENLEKIDINVKEDVIFDFKPAFNREVKKGQEENESPILEKPVREPVKMNITDKDNKNKTRIDKNNTGFPISSFKEIYQEEAGTLINKEMNPAEVKDFSTAPLKLNIKIDEINKDGEELTGNLVIETADIEQEESKQVYEPKHNSDFFSQTSSIPFKPSSDEVIIPVARFTEQDLKKFDNDLMKNSTDNGKKIDMTEIPDKPKQTLNNRESIFTASEETGIINQPVKVKLSRNTEENTEKTNNDIKIVNENNEKNDQTGKKIDLLLKDVETGEKIKAHIYVKPERQIEVNRNENREFLDDSILADRVKDEYINSTVRNENSSEEFTKEKFHFTKETKDKQNIRIANNKIEFSENLKQAETKEINSSGGKISKMNIRFETPEEMIESIVKYTKFSLSKERSEVTIKLEPEHLGKLHLKLVMKNSKLIGQIQVDNVEVKELISDNINQLKDSLQESGVDIQKFDVFTKEESNSQFNQNKEMRFNNRQSANQRNNEDSNLNDQTRDEYYRKNLRQFGYNSMELTV